MTNSNKIFEVGLRQILSYFLITVLFVYGLAQAGNQLESISVSEFPSGVALLDNRTESVTLKFNIGTVNFLPITTVEGEFVLPTVSGFSRSFKIGEPSLSMANKIISIPFGCQLQVDIISSEFETYDLEKFGITVFYTHCACFVNEKIH